MAKPPIDPVRWQAPPVGALPDFRAAALTLTAVPGGAPEDVVLHDRALQVLGLLWAILIALAVLV